VHQDTRACLGDYCFHERDFSKRFAESGLCPEECEVAAQEALREGWISLPEMVGARRLFNRASRRKICFVAMPFRESLNKVYAAIRQALAKSGWRVVRGDELRLPPIIVDAVIQTILVSDLVLADLTGRNPNVFHEVGIAQASGRDVLLLSQSAETPFNVRANRFVKYRPTPAGLALLSTELVKLAGNGRYGTVHRGKAGRSSLRP
jgi:hypothetical protein